ncbi:hypothetical protein ES703_52401 [subsurface metagenome]
MGYGAAGGAKSFLELEDTPAAYTTKALKVARVKATLDGLEFANQVTQYELPTNITPDQLTQEYSGGGPGARRMYVVGKFLLGCATGASGIITIYDITDIENPVSLSSIEYGYGYYDDFAVVGKYLFVVSSADNSIQVFDWSNPRSPAFKKFIATNEPKRCLARGRYLYTISYEFGGGYLRVWDISDPENPVERGYYTHATYLKYAYDLALSGNYCFVLSQEGYLTCVNIADPDNPTYVPNALNLGSFDNDRGGMKLVGHYIYIVHAKNDAFRIINIANPGTMVQAGQLVSATYLEKGSECFVIGDWAFVTTHPWGGAYLNVIDVSDRSSPQFQQSIPLGGTNQADYVMLAGKYCFMAWLTSTSGLIFSVWSIDIPAFIGNSIYAEYIYTNQLDVADLLTAVNSQLGGAAIPESLPKVFSIPLLLTQVVATDPDTAYTELSALYRTNLDFSKLGIKEARIIVSGIGNEATAGKGIQIWNSTDGAEICKAEWDADSQQNALAGSWATVSLRKAVDVQIRVKGSSATEDVTVDKVELQLRAA